MSKPNDDSWFTYLRGLLLLFLSRLYKRYKLLHPAGKVVVWCFILINLGVASLFIVVGPKRLAQTLYDFSQRLANNPYGWLILGLTMGYSTCVSLCGFAYGIKGMYLAAPGTLVGAGTSFVVLRYIGRRKIRHWTSQNEKWQALESVVKAKGLPLIILIRASPFPPWVYANAWLASIETISLWQFLVATIFVLPKIFLAVFIGSRIAAFSDGEQREHMDKTTTILNVVSILLSVLLAICMSYVVYNQVKKKIAEMQVSTNTDESLAADVLEQEEAPLLFNFSNESLTEQSQRRHSVDV